eukprot:NODE_357_length_8846_cov_0.279410.p6 type:complete len:116 gc:universal NODE_357_length_8846_cov_0.279410:3133-3480(+)
MRWKSIIEKFNVNMSPIKGSSNRSDYMSRPPNESLPVLSIIAVNYPLQLNFLKRCQDNDKDFNIVLKHMFKPSNKWLTKYQKLIAPNAYIHKIEGIELLCQSREDDSKQILVPLM